MGYQNIFFVVVVVSPHISACLKFIAIDRARLAPRVFCAWRCLKNVCRFNYRLKQSNENTKEIPNKKTVWLDALVNIIMDMSFSASNSEKNASLMYPIEEWFYDFIAR